MEELRGKCGMCGKCCEAIHIPVSPEDLTKYEGGDFKFVRENWIPITHEEAYEINPFLALSKELHEGRYFYTCTKLDKETGLCTVHENRPKVCSGYPWYGRRPEFKDPLYAEECGYKIDIEDEEERRRQAGEEPLPDINTVIRDRQKSKEEFEAIKDSISVDVEDGVE